MQNNDLISRSALLKKKFRTTEYDESGCGVPLLVVKTDDIENAPAVYAEAVRHTKCDRSMTELKPCPFCGSAAEIKQAYEKSIYIVCCKNCACMMAMFNCSYDAAKSEWNRRVSDENA